ncbi:MAG: hypothetical protein EHM42_05145 [Planctomycetaceae bacterium]|nr:MAG: hypothetical protein EHM42_05145 [Planctomycetaceae bacterium]
MKWISHLPGCSSISVSGDVIERSLAIVADAPWLSDLSLNGHSGKQQRPLVDLAPLRAAGRLRKFSINNAAIDRRSLESLSELRSLTSLHLQDVDLSADGAHGLAALRHLRKFSASFIALPTDSIARLAELPRECDVSLACHSPDDALLAQIAAIPQLRGLTLVGGAATDRGLAAFRGHRRLQTLSCDRIAGVTDAALESIAMLTELQRLNLSEVSITNAGIMRLSNASNLIGLRLRGTRVTQEAVDLLRTQRPGLSVDWWLF